MTDQERTSVVKSLSTWIRQNGPMPLRIMRNTLKEAGISPSTYEKVPPKQWITTKFPEFAIVGTNGHEHIVDTVPQLFNKAIKAEGSYPLASVPQLLYKNGISWKDLANGKRLSEWLSENYPALIIADDRLYMRTSAPPAPAPQPQPPSSQSDLTTRNYVHQFCYFPMNSTILTQIRELTGNAALTQSVWIASRTVAFAKCLLGLNGGLLDAAHSETPRMAFFTGMHTALDQDIYGILTQNGNEEAVQTWICNSFCFPGQDDKNGYGQWLCQTFGIPSQIFYGQDTAKLFESLKKSLQSLKEIHSKLLDEVPSAQALLMEGKPLAEEFSVAVLQYVEDWKDLTKTLRSMDTETLEEEYRLETVENIISQWSDSSRIIKEITERFKALAPAAWEYMTDNMLCPENLVDKDLSRWDELIMRDKNELTPETIAQLRKLMEPFQALQTLSVFDIKEKRVLDDMEYLALEQINEHFGSKLTPARLRVTIFSGETDFSFLNKLSEINSLLTTLENSICNMEAAAVEITDSNLLRLALEGNLWSVLNEAFPAPNPLETATMLGNAETVRELIGDAAAMGKMGYDEACRTQLLENARILQFSEVITPVCASERLESLLGPDCRQIDRCLFLGITQGEKGAAEHLLTHCLRQERFDLVQILYEACRSQLDGELRSQCLLALLVSGRIPLYKAVQDNILVLLTDEGNKAVSELDDPDSVCLQESLQALYADIHPILVHHVVFLSRDLQSYILRPENQSELSEYHLDMSESGIPALLKRESYARGSSPLQVAMRVNAFLGNWNGIAQRFALLDDNITERQSFLLELAMACGDVEQAFALLSENQELQRQNISFYRQILFQNREDQAFCGTVAPEEIPDLPVQTLLQLIIAQLRCGRWTGLLPEKDLAEAVAHPELLLELGQELAARDQEKHVEYLTALFPAAMLEVPEEQLHQLVTANDTLDDGALTKIAAGAVEICPALTAYCCHFLHTGAFAEERAAYLRHLYDRLNHEPLPEQYRIAQELRILDPEQYTAVVEKLIETQIFSILEEDQPDQHKAEALSSLLRANSVNDAAYQRLLRHLSGQALTVNPPLYQTLLSLAQSDEARIACLRLLHQYRSQGGEDFRRALCSQYVELVEQNKLPDDMLVECESVILSLLRQKFDLSQCVCVYRIERTRERKPFILFALNALTAYLNEMLSPAVRQELEEDVQRFLEDDSVSELALFCEILENSDIEIEEYLSFCSVFASVENQDVLPSQEDSGNADTDILSILHALYHRPLDPHTWSACTKLPFQDRTIAYANALYHSACCISQDTNENPNSAWEKCVVYCLSEGQDKMFFRAIHKWIQVINTQYVDRIPWYAAKHFVQTIQGLLDTDDPVFASELHTVLSAPGAFPACEPGEAEALLQDMIYVFKRIDQSDFSNVNQDDNHNILRMILEFGVKLNQEELLIQQLFDELMGPYVNLGLAIICRLLLLEKYDAAVSFLPKFAAQSRREYNYHHLVNKLAKMGKAELLEWLEYEGNRATLRFILPNGNAPDILRLQTIVMSGIAEKTTDISLAVIENLLDCYPKDTMCYTSLFILCKEDYNAHLPQLMRSLYGVYKYYSQKGLFTRSQGELIRLITILRFAMEMKGYTDLPPESVTELIRSYCRSPEYIDQVVSQQNRLAEEIRSLFVGVAPDSAAFDLFMNSLLGAVTGNWLPFLTLAYQNKLTQWVRTYNVGKYSNWGLLRGILRVWRNQPSSEEREQFANWIQAETTGDSKDVQFQKYISSPSQFIMLKTIAENVNWDMLRLPWEEHFVCLGNLKDIKRPERNSCYKWMMMMRPKDRSAKDSFIIMLRLSQDVLKAQLLSGNAKEWFRTGDYELAAASYDALFRTGQIPVLTRSSEEKAQHYVSFMELHQTWSRIAYVFAGQTQMVSPGRTLSMHSSYNMIISLLNEGYAKYYDRLRSCFPVGANRVLFDTIRKVLTTPMSNDELVQIANTFHDRSLLIAYLHFLLSRDQTGKYLFLTDPKHMEEVPIKLKRQESTLAGQRKQKLWFPLTVRPDASLFPPLPEDEAAQSAGMAAFRSGVSGEEPKIDLLYGANGEAFEPAFLMDAAELCGENDNVVVGAAALEVQYRTLTPYSDSDYSKRLSISSQLYQLTQADDSTAARKQQSIVQFGVDYYLYHRGRIGVTGQAEKERGLAHRAMLDLARYGLNKPAISMMVAQQLPNWFQYSIRGFTSIDKLLEDYSNNQHGYMAVSKLLSDSDHADAANGILEILNDLLAVSNRLGSRTIDTAGYQMAQSRLNDISTTRDWNEMAAHLSELLRKALNELDQRPSLRVRLYNTELGLQSDSLYGQIENTGRESALDLNLQATFPNNQRQPISASYHFSELRPNEAVTFAVRYTTDDDVLELEYTLNLRYQDQRGEHTVDPVSGVLAISPNVQAPATIPQFDTFRASAFSINEKGQIVSRDFKGRKTEIQKLTGLLKGDSFSQYQSAIVQGIKRSGKTSLLNYLRAYIRAKKDQDTIQLWFDCQTLTKQYIYSAFFRPALEELPLEHPQIVKHPDWKNFISTWQRGPGDPDQDPSGLSVFYRQLHGLLDGKGIYLIVDEFDALLDKLADDGGFEGLLNALRGLQMNPDCFEAVHLVLCGSNHLLAYNRVGSYTNQMFQSYELIQVGQMQTKDICDMIRSLLETESSIRFDDEGASIQWIERYTGGLVWYTRLLVNEVIKNVLRDGRNCAYPSDVCDAFDSICSYQNCRQFVEGCSQTDLIVLDVVQSLADRFGKYVSADQIAQRLKSRLTSDQLTLSLSILTDTLELLERQAPNSKMYRFRVEIYRRYFRLQAGTKTLGDCFKPNDLSVKTDDADSEFE